MPNYLKLLFVSLVFTTFISCKKDDKPVSDIVTFKATLSGTNEVPSNTSMASGSSTLTYNKSTKTFSIVTTYSGLTPTMGHIHKAVKGVNGAVIFPFTNVGTSPIKLESSITDEQFQAMEKDSMYVNLHTTAFPGGEIRGQLMKQ
ncbi:MAG: CHRD domain-containing protein [Ginsengibacter sp.]|jgi:hypothetical protein